MKDVQLSVKNFVEGNMTIEECLVDCDKLIKDVASRWYAKTGLVDGRDREEKIQLCSIWCWESLTRYDITRGYKFTTFYYSHVGNMIKNAMKKSVNDNEKANNYSNCFSYELTVASENDSEQKNTFYGMEYIDEDGFSYVEMEMLLKQNGFDDITVDIVKHKMDSPKIPDAEIAKMLGYSRAYISLLWRKVKPFLIKELRLA